MFEYYEEDMESTAAMFAYIEGIGRKGVWEIKKMLLTKTVKPTEEARVLLNELYGAAQAVEMRFAYLEEAAWEVEGRKTERGLGPC